MERLIHDDDLNKRWSAWQSAHPGAATALAEARAKDQATFSALFNEYWAAAQDGRAIPSLQQKALSASDIYAAREKARRARTAAGMPQREDDAEEQPERHGDVRAKFEAMATDFYAQRATARMAKQMAAATAQ
jgi:hypothetical protein